MLLLFIAIINLGNRHATNEQIGGDQAAIGPAALNRFFQQLFYWRHLIPARLVGVDPTTEDFLRLSLNGQLMQASQIILVEVAATVARPCEDFFFQHLAGAFAARAWLLAIAAADRAILLECLVANCAVSVFHTPHL